MKEIHKYIADDGTEFDDMRECQEYEILNQIDDMGNDIQFYDINHEPCNLQDADFIIARTPAAKELLKQLCDFYDCNRPWELSPYEDKASEESNAWIWNSEHEEWQSFNYLCEQARELNTKTSRIGNWLLR